MNVNIWREFSEQVGIRSSEQESTNDRYWHRWREFTLDQSRELCGIIRHLSEMCGGNVHDKGVVRVTSSEYNTGYGALKVAAQFDGLSKDMFFYTIWRKPAWICYDFGDHRVIPTAYSIRTYFNNNGNFFFARSWVVEASDTGIDNDFDVIDTHENDDTMKAQYTVYSFPIQTRKQCRYLRMRLTSPGGQDCTALIFSAWEIFGTLL
jgi:hypothetical protein